MMNNTSDTKNTVKRGRGRPKKDAVIRPEIEVKKTVASARLPALLEPNIHDINDELVRMDSFAYSRYND